MNNLPDSQEKFLQEILSRGELYPFDNYSERIAYIKTVTDSKGTLCEEHRKPLTILIVGGTNVGKSQLFNRLLGKEISPVKEIAGYTRDFFVAAGEKTNPELLGNFNLNPERLYKTSLKWMEGKILIDSPDFDSIDDNNRKRLERLLPSAHVIVVMVTMAKREIAPLYEILARYVGKKHFLFVMNKQDREENYQKKFNLFLEALGFSGPRIIRASCLPCQLSLDNQWINGPERVQREINEIDAQQAKTRKFQGDLRDRLELIYSRNEVGPLIRKLEKRQKKYRKEARQVVQADLSGILNSLAEHPRIVRDVVLVEVAQAGGGILARILKAWARYRFLLALAGAGSLLSKASGSVIPFFSGVVSGLLTQSGQINSLSSLRSQLRGELKTRRAGEFFRSCQSGARKLLSARRIRKDLIPSTDFNLLEKEVGLVEEQAVEKFISGLVGRGYRRILWFLEILTWSGTGAYGFFRSWQLYQLKQMSLESMVFSSVICFLMLALFFLTGFVGYLGASTKRKLKNADRSTKLDLSELDDLVFQPAIDSLKRFEQSVEKALQSIN